MMSQVVCISLPNRDREGVIMGLRPTKRDGDAECINSWQAKALAPHLDETHCMVNVGQALSPANSAGNEGRLKRRDHGPAAHQR